MGTKTLIGAVPLLLIALACDVSGPASSLSHAAAMLQCGPGDGPVTVIVLAHDSVVFAHPSYPLVSVAISAQVSALAGRRWDIPSDTGVVAWYVTGAGKAQPAISGRVTVTRVDSTKRVDGTVELQFPSRIVATAFSAPWIDSGVTCG